MKTQAGEGMTLKGFMLLLAMALAFLLLLAVSGGISWFKDRDLRGDDLVVTQARVIDFYKATRQSRFDVEFIASDGQRVRATIPVKGSKTTNGGKMVEVAYVERDPQRVRTVDGWQPWYEQVKDTAILTFFVLFFALVWLGLTTLWRSKRPART